MTTTSDRPPCRHECGRRSYEGRSECGSCRHKRRNDGHRMAYEVDPDTIAMVVAARYGGDSLTLAERPIAARHLYADGLNAREVADILGVTERSVYRYVAGTPRTNLIRGRTTHVREGRTRLRNVLAASRNAGHVF